MAKTTQHRVAMVVAITTSMALGLLLRRSRPKSAAKPDPTPNPPLPVPGLPRVEPCSPAAARALAEVDRALAGLGVRIEGRDEAALSGEGAAATYGYFIQRGAPLAATHHPEESI